MKLFVRTANCPLCHKALELAPADAELFDVETVDGMAEYCDCYSGGSTVPVLIYGDDVYVGDDVIEYLKGRGDSSDSETD